MNTQADAPGNDGQARQGAFADSGLPFAVVVASTRWDEPPRIRHHVTRQLMRWFNVLFVEFFPTRKTEQGVARWRRLGDKLTVWAPEPPIRIPIRVYANDPLTHKAVNLYFAKAIGDAVRSQPHQTAVLFNFVYDFYEVMSDAEFAYTAYVCFDEFPRMQRRAHRRNPIKARYQAELFQHYENQVARMAGRCFTPHYPLREKLLKVNSRVDMLFHAHDYDLSTARAPRRGAGTIKVGFAGHIDWRLLRDWLVAILQEPDMELHMIGPVSERFDLAALTAYPSMHYVPTLSEDQLLHKLSEMDVLIMPYDPAIPEVSILTTNSKTFQYVAAGKPIVISNLPHYIELPHGVIYKAKEATAFATEIRRVYEEDCEQYVALRRRIASENTWSARGDALLESLKQDLPMLQGLESGER